MATLDCRINLTADRDELRALQKDDLRLDQPRAFKLDPSQSENERVLCVCFDRKQRRRTYCGMDGVRQRSEVDQQALAPVGDAFDWLGQPGRCPQHQSCDLRFAMKLRMQFGLPAEFQSWRRSDREPARQRAMRGNEKG